VTEVQIRAFERWDAGWVEALLDEAFAGRWQARRGELIDVMAYEGLVAVDRAGNGVGFLSYRRDGDECEIAAFVVAQRLGGIGTAMVEQLRQALTGVCTRVWLVTTNDNIDALRFYQRRGFRLSALRPGAVDDSRRGLKPRIGQTGDYGIPLRDELELELPLV
jgi:ribosomal protein S18 acetylase RimI-like enzyme